MSQKLRIAADEHDLIIYEIKIHGHLGPQWTSWFDGMTIILEDTGDTVLRGPVVDQAALHGLIRKVRDTGMPLISINPVSEAR